MQPNGTNLMIFIILGTLVFLVLGALLTILLLIFKKKQTKNIQEKAALKAAYEQEILQSQIEVQNQTLQQIGQELHDNIGQILSVARLNLNILEESGLSNETSVQIKDTNELVNKAISDVRTLSKSLDGDFVKDFGLEQSIVHELNRLRKTGIFQTEIEVKGTRTGLGFQKEIVLFRITQEIINNALKHAQASNLKVCLDYTDGFLLKIEDNGKGFDYHKLIEKNLSTSGAGLRNIERRVESIGGECTIESSVGEGTKIEITL